MREAIVNKGFIFISKHNELDHYNEVKIKYGLEVMYSFITKTVAIIIMSLVFGFFVDNLLVLIFYGILRTFAHGVHAKTNSNCWISTMITYFITGVTCKYFIFNNLLIYIISILSFIIIAIYAPSDSIHRPIKRKNKRIALKIKAILTSIMLISILLLTKFKYKPSIIISLILCVISINPITYKILKTSRNNYKVNS